GSHDFGCCTRVTSVTLVTMRRFRTSSSRARKSSAVFGILALAALVGGLLPSAASAQTDPAATPAPTVEPAPAETEAPDDGVIRDGYTTDPTGEPTAEPTAEPTEAPAPTAEPTPEPTEAPEDDIVGEIPTPENGGYIGSNIEDEADPGAYSATQDGLRAATLSGFRPGNIISDAKMYTSGTMSASQIQSFFNGKVRSCDPNYTCLKDFKMNTVSKSPNSYCTGSYQGGRNESAATIISKVSKACKVSEKVLIVMLQKEQGLVTHTWPSQFRYDIAMGYACPDDAACNAKYFGFQNQMYMAAYQLQRYTKDSYFSWYPVGKTSQVRYHPNASCGSGAVRIENKATAALYYYTPYQPNRAALNAGYGVGDSCSAYGNRNFYNYYTDWFGGTREPSKPTKPNTPSVTGAIGEKWKSLGGASGKLGQPISAEKCGLSRYNGCYQDFQGGQIFWSKKTGAHFTTGSIRVEWRSGGAQNGSLGYPTSDERCGLAKGGCYQVFEGGGVYWSPATGASTVGGKILPGWNAVNKEKGALGYP